jgi:Thiolase, C-terminal domain
MKPTQPANGRPEVLIVGDGAAFILELRRRGQKRGLATACIGGGQGIAAIVDTT